jgi:hypothetical protein
MNKENFKIELQECKKMFMFEFKTINDDYLLIDIEYNEYNDVFLWTSKDKIKKFNIDYDFSLDMNLQALYDDIISEYINIIDFEN